MNKYEQSLDWYWQGNTYGFADRSFEFSTNSQTNTSIMPLSYILSSWWNYLFAARRSCSTPECFTLLRSCSQLLNLPQRKWDKQRLSPPRPTKREPSPPVRLQLQSASQEQTSDFHWLTDNITSVHVEGTDGLPANTVNRITCHVRCSMFG